MRVIKAGITERECRICGQTKPVEEFRYRTSRQSGFCAPCRKKRKAEQMLPINRNRKRFPCVYECGNTVLNYKGRCKACYQKMSGPKPPKTVAERIKVAKAKKADVPQPVGHACLGECGTLLFTEIQYCKPCSHHRQDKIAHSAHEGSVSSKTLKSLAEDKIYGAIWLEDEAISLNNLCPCPLESHGHKGRCKKPVLVSGRCYKCATGEDRTLTALPKVEYSNKALV